MRCSGRPQVAARATLEAKGALIVGLNARVTGGMVANIGTAPTVIGPAARVGPTASVGSVTLLSHTVVDGDLRTSGALVRLPDVTVGFAI